MLSPHPQLAPYEQSHDAEGTINPSEKTCSARKFLGALLAGGFAQSSARTSTTG